MALLKQVRRQEPQGLSWVLGFDLGEAQDVLLFCISAGLGQEALQSVQASREATFAHSTWLSHTLRGCDPSELGAAELPPAPRFHDSCSWQRHRPEARGGQKTAALTQ